MVYEQDFQKNRLIERYSPFATSCMLQILKTSVKYKYRFCVFQCFKYLLNNEKKVGLQTYFFSPVRNLSHFKMI